MGDRKQVPYGGLTDVRCCSTKFNNPGNSAPGICAPRYLSWRWVTLVFEMLHWISDVEQEAVNPDISCSYPRSVCTGKILSNTPHDRLYTETFEILLFSNSVFGRFSFWHCEVIFLVKHNESLYHTCVAFSCRQQTRGRGTIDEILYEVMLLS